MKSNNRSLIILSIIACVLSIWILISQKDSDPDVWTYVIYYMSSIAMVVSVLLLFLLFRKKRVNVFVSYSEDSENIYRDLKKQIEYGNIGKKVNINVKCSKDMSEIAKCSYAFVILNKKLTGKQKHEIKLLSIFKKNYIAIMVGENVSIPSDFMPVKTIIYRPT